MALSGKEDLSVKLFLQVMPSSGRAESCSAPLSLRTALLCIMCVSVVALFAFGLQVQQGAVRQIPALQSRFTQSAYTTESVARLFSGTGPERTNAASSRGAGHAKASHGTATTADNDEEDIFDFVEKTLQRIRDAKKKEAMALASQQEKERGQLTGQKGGAAHAAVDKAENAFGEAFDNSIVVGPHHDDATHANATKERSHVPGSHRGRDGSGNEKSENPLQFHVQPPPGATGMNKNPEAGLQQQNSLKNGTHLDGNGSVVTEPPPYKWPYQKESEEAENISDSAWDHYDNVLTERIYKRNGTFHIPETVPFRCMDQRAWTAQCYKTCVSGTGRVPRLVHFLQVGDNMKFLHWLAVMSAIRFIRPDLVMVHYLGEQTTCWSRRIRAHPLVVFKELTNELIPTALNGANISNLAHRADFLRLTMLWQYGGVYMDFDALITKSFDPLMNQEAVVSYQITQELGNGLMVTRPRSCFICGYAKRACHNFDGRWTTHSVVTLTRMLKFERHIFPNVMILKASEGFFPFCYTPEYLDRLFNWDVEQAKFDLTKVFALHLYNKMSAHYSAKISYDWIVMQRSAVALNAQKILPYGFNREHMDDLKCLTVPLVFPL